MRAAGILSWTSTLRKMLSLKNFPYLHRHITPLKSLLRSSIHPSLSPLSLPRRFVPLPPLSFSTAAASSATSATSAKMQPFSTVEHIVLFKVRDSTDPSKTDAMIANLRSLASLEIVTHLTAGPILRLRSAAAESLGFTHLLHSRYRSKSDLAAYTVHPAHVAVVKDNVLPICDDIMAVDWVADIEGDAAPLPGSVLRLTLAKPREAAAVAEIVEAIDGGRASVPDVVQVSYGVNFSPARAKGYDVGFVSVFPGLDELEALEGNEEMEKHKEKLRPLLDTVIVVDFLIPSPASSL